MGVRDNHTKYEPHPQQWRPGMGVASAGPPFQNLQFWAKISLFWPKTALEPAENGQMKGTSGYSTQTTRTLLLPLPELLLVVLPLPLLLVPLLPLPVLDAPTPADGDGDAEATPLLLPLPELLVLVLPLSLLLVPLLPLPVLDAPTPVPKGPLGPYNSTICPQTTPKIPPKAPDFLRMCFFKNDPASSKHTRLPRASDSTICPRTAPKRHPKAPQFVHNGRRQPQTKNGPDLGLRGSKHDFEST